MPFLPSSPTRLYPRRKSKQINLLLNKVEGAPSDAAEKYKASITNPPPELTNHPPAAEDSAAMSIGEESHRKSMTSLKEAPVWHNIEKDFLVNNVSDIERKHLQNGTSTTASSPADNVSSASPQADKNDIGIPVDTTDDKSTTASSQRVAFFDSTPESEYSVEEDTQPVVGRASSVRVSKPQIVQHKPTELLKAYVGSQSHLRSNSNSSFKAERIFGYQSALLPSTPEESGLRSPSDRTSSVIPEGFQNEQPTVNRSSPHAITPPLRESDNGGPRALSENSAGTTKALPSGNTLHSVRPSIVCVEGLLNADGGLQQASQAVPTQILNRTMSSPLPLPGKGLSRRVTIRPADLIIKNHDVQNSFRESVVTTPYPPRVSIDTNSMNFEEKRKGCKEEKSRSIKEKERQKMSFQHVPSEVSPQVVKDRFPSPERPEVLFVDLNLFRHPSARTTIEIQIADKGVFDDELFFQHIRTAYSKQLLGLPRLAFTLVRRICCVSVTAPTNYNTAGFNNIDFIKHFQNPRLGRKRKAWVIWLRNNNPRSVAPTATIIDPNGAPIRQIDNLNHLSLRARMSGHGRRPSWNKIHHTDKDVNTTEENKRFSTASDASSFHFVYSPAMPRLPFLSRSGDPSPTANAVPESPCRSFFWPSNFSSPSASRSGNTDEGHAVRIARLSFHHEFKAGVIALLTLFVILQAVAASLVWVIFGVPGTRPGMDGEQHTSGHVATIKTDWRVDSKSRVLTGVVIGLVVLIIGGLLEGALVWGSWLLL